MLVHEPAHTHPIDPELADDRPPLDDRPRCVGCEPIPGRLWTRCRGGRSVQMRAALRGRDYDAQVQMLSPDGRGNSPRDVHGAAAVGISTGGGTLPYAAQIQRSFGGYDISHVQAHTSAQAQASAAWMGADAYATGNHVVLGAGGQDLHTVAHEAAHVVQQRAGVALSGGVGKAGDPYEQHADAVADRVVRGESAEDLLSQVSGGGASVGGAVQMRGGDGAPRGRENRHLQTGDTPRTGGAYNLGTSGKRPYDVIQDVARGLERVVSTRLEKIASALESLESNYQLMPEDSDGGLLGGILGAVSSEALTGLLEKVPLLSEFYNVASTVSEQAAEARATKGREACRQFINRFRTTEIARMIDRASGTYDSVVSRFDDRFNALNQTSIPPYRDGDPWVEGAAGQYLHTIEGHARDAKALEERETISTLEARLHNLWISGQARHARGNGTEGFREVLVDGYIRVHFEGVAVWNRNGSAVEDYRDIVCTDVSVKAPGGELALRRLKELMNPFDIWKIETPKRLLLHDKSGGHLPAHVDVELGPLNELRTIHGHRGLFAVVSGRMVGASVSVDQVRAG
jgi:hypothetical protein